MLLVYVVRPLQALDVLHYDYNIYVSLPLDGPIGQWTLLDWDSKT